MLKNCRISGFADEINRDFDVQMAVLKELGQKYVELRSADGTSVADLTCETAAELGERMAAAGSVRLICRISHRKNHDYR